MAEIQSELKYGRIYVFASMNGSEPMRMLLDTGAFTNSVTRTAAQRLGLVANGQWAIRDFHGTKEKYDRAAIDELRLGPLLLRDFEVLVTSDRATPDIFGVIGMLGIQDHTLSIDFDSGHVELNDHRLDANKAGVMAFRLTPDYKAKVPINIRNADGEMKRVWAVLDTGFNGILTLDQKNAQAFTRPDGLVIHDRAYGAHGPTKSWAVDGYLIEGDVQLGDLTYSRVVAAADQTAINLGIDMLEGCRVTIDWPSRLFHIERADKASRLVDLMSYWIIPMDDGHGGLSILTAHNTDAFSQGLDYKKTVISINGQTPDSRFIEKQLWPIPVDDTEIVIEYLDPETGEHGICRLPIDERGSRQ